MEPPELTDPRVMAAIVMIGRVGATFFQIRYSDDPEPTVWVADAEWDNSHACAAGMTPGEAVLRLLDVVANGGICAHCGRPTRIEHDWSAPSVMGDVICWYKFDPELETYRRHCEGRVKRLVGRNDPCPCGSGKKLKHCHG